jgi:hypothetical protein
MRSPAREMSGMRPRKLIKPTTLGRVHPIHIGPWRKKWEAMRRSACA